MNDKLAIPNPRRTGRTVLHWIVALAILAGGGFAAKMLIDSAPRPKPRTPERGRTFVDTMGAEFKRQPVVIEAQGTVMAAQMVTMQPRVSGEVVEMSPEMLPGGFVKKGAMLLRVDPADYELAIPAAERVVAEMVSARRTEEGNQAIAKRDFELLGQKIAEEDRDLVLREPQIAAARAGERAAQANLEKAKLDLERTTISAPFNAVIEKRGVDRGAMVTPQTQLATLIGTDAFWVEVAVPVSALRWLEIPADGSDKGSKVRLFDTAAWADDVSREGRVIRKLAGVEEKGRMARLLVEVDDPLALRAENAGKPAMLIGSYVRAEIEGREVDSAFAIPRDLVHAGDKIWIVADDETLDIRDAEVAFRGRDTLLLTGGVKAGERVVTTQLAAPVQGMALRTKRDKKADEPTP